MTEPLSTPTPPLSCEEALRQIDCLVEEGSLKNAERALLMAHLDSCTACRGNLERRRQLDARLREAFADLDTRPDFTQRLLDMLPKREGGISSAWRRPALRASGVHSRLKNGQRGDGETTISGRTLALPLAAAAVFLLVIAGWWLTRGSGPDGPQATVAEFKGALVLERNGEPVALADGLLLTAGDVLTARLRSGEDTGSCTLNVEGGPYCTIRLADGAELSVLGTGNYELHQGEAYFEVDPDRWGAKERPFAVRTNLGRAVVVGTTFGVIVPSKQSDKVMVVVDKGEVELRSWSGAKQSVCANEECSIKKDGTTTSPQAIAAGRMRRLRPPMAVAVEPVGAMPAITKKAPPPVARPPAPRHVNWTANVKDLDFRGCSLTEALQRLQKRLGVADEWPVLIAQAGKLAPHGKSALQVRRAVRVDAVVRWLARENGLQFKQPMTLEPVPKDALLGMPEYGSVPTGLAKLLDESAEGLPEQVAGEVGLRMLANRTGLAVLIEAKTSLPCVDRSATWRGLLESLALASEADWAWYDGILYVASSREIDALTKRLRTEALAQWLGKQPLPAWEKSLKQLLSGLCLDGEQLTVSKKGMLWDVALYPDKRGLQYTAGIRGVRTVAALHRLLERGSFLVPDAGDVLNELEAAGTYRGLDALVELARDRAHVVWEGEKRFFPMQSFSVRRMPLGRALERGARLHGLGLRLEPGRLVVDEHAACYGEPALQVVSLADVAKHCGRAALQLPEALAREARACWPELLKGLELLPLHQALAFHGDRRQLAAVQEVAGEMKRAAQAGLLKPQEWRMSWRVAVERNLAEPFRGDESGTLPAGSFVGLLRQSGLFIPLKTAVLVDPVAMKELANRRLPALDVRGQTTGQALETLARAVGLRMIIEDGVIWLKP